jgi:hypothetical protein
MGGWGGRGERAYRVLPIRMPICTLRVILKGPQAALSGPGPPGEAGGERLQPFA